MDLSKKDRVFLINQYQILKSLYPNESSHYDELIEILQNGYEIFYSMIDEWVGDEMPADQGRLVLDILNFYRFVEDYKLNNPDDKEVNDNLWSLFRGFDGNSESEYMGFARFLINRQNKFSEQQQYKQKTDNFNSHMPTLEKYSNMIQAWRKLGGNYLNSREDILTVLAS